MITPKTLYELDVESQDENKLLLAAIAVLTTLDNTKAIITNNTNPNSYIKLKEYTWGSHMTPEQTIQQLTDLANKIYYPNEWETEQIRINRDNKLNQIL